MDNEACCALCSCLQDVILRAGQALPLYARVVEAGGPRALVLPAAADGCLQVRSDIQHRM